MMQSAGTVPVLAGVTVPVLAGVMAMRSPGTSSLWDTVTQELLLLLLLLLLLRRHVTLASCPVSARISRRALTKLKKKYDEEEAGGDGGT